MFVEELYRAVLASSERRERSFGACDWSDRAGEERGAAGPDRLSQPILVLTPPSSSLWNADRAG